MGAAVGLLAPFDGRQTYGERAAELSRMLVAAGQSAVTAGQMKELGLRTIERLAAGWRQQKCGMFFRAWRAEVAASRERSTATEAAAGL